MVASFFGLYSSQKTLSTIQTTLNIISNNIANANTPSYSRQSVDLLTSSPYPQPMPGVCGLPGTFGTGTEIGSIKRIRDSFLDAQYRIENCTSSYYTEKQYAFDSAESIMNEPSDSGLLSKMSTFFESAQKLSQSPESLPARTDFVLQASDLAVVFNQQSASLQELRKNLVGEATDPNSLTQSRLGMGISSINSQLENLANVNREIITLRGNGVEPNDLLDQRDKILDNLSTFMPLTVEESVVGTVDVSIGNNVLVSGSNLVNVLKADAGNINTPTIVALYSPDGTGPNVANINSLITSGQLGGILELGSNDPSKVTIKKLMDNLDTLAQSIATNVNNLQSQGRYIYSDPTAVPPIKELRSAAADYPTIFESSNANPINALNIRVTQNIIDDPFRIAAAANNAAIPNTALGDGSQALDIAQLRDNTTLGPGNTTFSNFLSSNISILGVEAKSNNDKLESQDALMKQVDLRRESTSGVNIDEELVDLIRFQRAFEASSRVMTTINEVLQVLINKM